MTFSYRDLRRRLPQLTLGAEAFLHRFLQHVLPRGFQRVRHFGWWHPGGRVKLNRVRALLRQTPVLSETERATGQPPAELSVLQQLDAGYSDLLQANLGELFEDFWRCRQRREAAAKKMIALLHQLQAEGQVRLQARKEFINDFLLARILAETGPLEDFPSWPQLLRYAGMNLCERQSELYGTYYHGKKARGMAGQKAMMAVARKFLKALWGLDRSAQSFDPKRIFCCASQFTAQAKALAA